MLLPVMLNEQICSTLIWRVKANLQLDALTVPQNYRYYLQVELKATNQKPNPERPKVFDISTTQSLVNTKQVPEIKHFPSIAS